MTKIHNQVNKKYFYGDPDDILWHNLYELNLTQDYTNKNPQLTHIRDTNICDLDYHSSVNFNPKAELIILIKQKNPNFTPNYFFVAYINKGKYVHKYNSYKYTIIASIKFEKKSSAIKKCLNRKN